MPDYRNRFQQKRNYQVKNGAVVQIRDRVVLDTGCHPKSARQMAVHSSVYYITVYTGEFGNTPSRDALQTLPN
jgi:hypothetical protein